MQEFIRRHLPAAVAVLLLATAAGAPAETGPAAGPAAPPAVKLDKGMTAAQIIRSLGQPVELLPIPNTDGKAERWIYRWTVGPKSTARSVQVLTLLMINGELVVAQQTVEPKAAEGK